MSAHPALHVVGRESEGELISMQQGSDESGIPYRTLARAVKCGEVPSACVLRLGERYVRLRRGPFMRWVERGEA